MHELTITLTTFVNIVIYITLHIHFETQNLHMSYLQQETTTLFN